MKTSIETFMNTLSKWGYSLTGKGGDYPSTLLVLTGQLGDLSLIGSSEATVEELELHLKNRIYEIIEKTNMSSSVLIMGLTQSLLQWLNHDSLSTVGNLLTFEKFNDEFPNSEQGPKLLEKIKSSEYHANTNREYYEWLKLSVEFLGMDSVKSWENEELLERTKK